MSNIVWRRWEGGFGMIEVMIALMIVMIGILGLVALQGRAVTSQVEAYKRAQAIVIAKDMVARINANRDEAATYATTGLGTGATLSTNCSGLIGKNLDFCEWHKILLGAAETSTGGASLGAMAEARGCITYSDPGSGLPIQVVVTVVWRGITPAPGPAVACGTGAYGTDDAFRRVVTIPITFADLSA